MTDEQLFYTIISTIAAVAALYWGHKHWRLRQAARQPFPSAWSNILAARLPPYRHLPAELRQQLEQQVKMFLFHKQFIGCGGLEVTDEMRLTIAGQACLLLLNRVTNEYDELRWIYIYPSAFVAQKEMRDEAGVVSHGPVGLLGESWDNGKVILSWDDVEHGVQDFSDGHNVVLHEFAHQLDHESGVTNGAPILSGGPNAYRTWASIFAAEFEALQRDAAHGQPSVIDHYGATDAAEFFAVATETFFERPGAMKHHHPALYRELQNYYRLDPVQWTTP